MEREIKFRGLNEKTNKWVFGGIRISEQDKVACIHPLIETGSWCDWKEIFVKYESVGQYTGLKDKNGVEIYEGDLLHRHLGVKWKVKFKNSKWIADGNDSGLYLSANQFNESEVIGNIHEK